MRRRRRDGRSANGRVLFVCLISVCLTYCLSVPQAEAGSWSIPSRPPCSDAAAAAAPLRAEGSGAAGAPAGPVAGAAPQHQERAHTVQIYVPQCWHPPF